MYELIKIKDNIYYIPGKTNVGVYNYSKNLVVLIDCGQDENDAKIIDEVLGKEKYIVTDILLTHGHADHCGGNNYFQNKYQCQTYATNYERAFVENPILEPTLFYGGMPYNEMQIPFIKATSSACIDLNKMKIDGVKVISLPGHTLGHVGYKINDIYFLGDALCGKQIIDKAHISYLFDIKTQLETLDFINNFNGFACVCSHASLTYDVSFLVNYNKEKILDVIYQIKKILDKPKSEIDVIRELFTVYNLKMNLIQYSLVGCTIRSYLTYLYTQKEIQPIIENQIVYWQKREAI